MHIPVTNCWSADDPTETDWESCAAEIERRCRILCELMRRPMPLGVERWLLGVEDGAWLEAHYSEGRGKLARLQWSRGEPRQTAAFVAECETWCARVDRELALRERQAGIMDVGRKLLLSALVLALLALLEMVIQQNLLTKFFDPLIRAVGKQGLLRLMPIVIAAAVIGTVVGVVLMVIGLRRPRLASFLRLLLLSPLTLALIVASGGLGTVTVGSDTQNVPTSLTVTMNLKAIAAACGYALPILVHMIQRGFPLRSLTQLRQDHVDNIKIAVGSLVSMARSEPPTAASPPESPPRSGSLSGW